MAQHEPSAPLLKQLEPWSVPADTPIWRPDDRVNEFIFLERGIVTASTPFADKTATVWIIGGWFFIGGRRLIKGRRAITFYTAKTAATGFKLPRKVITDAMKSDHAIRHRVRRLVDVMDLAVLQWNFCIVARHTNEQRFCRHLLMMDDVIDGHRIELSVPAFGEIAGITRSTAERIAQDLERGRIISKTRKSIVIRDRHAIENRTCECYRVMIERRDSVYSANR